MADPAATPPVSSGPSTPSCLPDDPRAMQITALVALLLGMTMLGASYVLKGVSLLPHQYTKGLELIYGISSLCLQTLSLFFFALSPIFFVGGYIAKRYLPQPPAAADS